MTRIRDLSNESLSLADDDLLVIDEASSGTTKKIKGSAIAAKSPVQSVAGKTGTVILNKGDVGLGNVENTTLSTWAGSISITTLGTISTGTVPAANVSGLATSATTDTTNASNISSGTLAAARLPSVNLGTTSVDLTRASGALSLSGVSIDGNAGTVTNGVYTTGSYSDPSWLTLSKSKVGLGNVENTALSTWGGSTNITTLGTIATGTVPWANVGSKPTTISGYGITDAPTLTGNNTLSGANTLTIAPGSAAAPSLYPTGDPNTGIYSPGADQLAVSTGGTQRLTVDASGNLGIGTASPSCRLDVASTDAIKVAAGTTAQRPATPANGMIRYNSDTGKPEVYANGWVSLSLEGQFPIASLSWNESTDTYSNTSSVLDVQSRMRRCVLTDAGAIAYYLDADDSTKRSGDWLRIVGTQTISTDYTGTLTETANASLRDGVSNADGAVSGRLAYGQA